MSKQLFSRTKLNGVYPEFFLDYSIQVSKRALTLDDSHTLISDHWNVAYHSKYGAITEGKHVFIKNGLDLIQTRHDSFRILEMGFGTGLNAFLAIIRSNELDKSVHYTGLETHPVKESEWASLNYPTLLKSDQSAFNQLHHLEWNTWHTLSPKTNFRKLSQSILDYIPDSNYNIVFFDAFAPESQAELWTEDCFQVMYNCLDPGGLLTTYCAKGYVKRNLRSVGFHVEAVGGPPGKREMTLAWKP